ncbi:MAG TPA: NAD-dependent epimerase/dehydratase family protein [Kofleriaceae bacterium]|nr:NAD-dependent epimerase/dehydratase family protein [Kofleriaceae bacterium]
MRVLVTGATTSLGDALVRALLAEPTVEHVLAVAIEPGVQDAPRLSYRRVDLTRERAVHDLVHGLAAELAIDAVVHAAMHRDARDEGPAIHARNVDATRRLLHACLDVPAIGRFVFPGSAAVYAVRPGAPTLLDEDAPLEFDPRAPQWVRDRVEADLTVCAAMGMRHLALTVLRGAEILAPGTGSQLWDYLQSRVCLRPAGFDPMINLLTLDDAVAAIVGALAAGRSGVYNIAGADTLPLSCLIRRWGRRDVPVPGPLLAPLYRLRTWTTGRKFRYDLNARRFHLGGIVDDRRARAELGYRPSHPIRWPHDAGGFSRSGLKT